MRFAERVIKVTETAADLWQDLPISHEPEWRRVAEDAETILRTVVILIREKRVRALQALAGYAFMIRKDTNYDYPK